MVRSPAFLRRAELLQQVGIALAWEPGRAVARGFADLGYEEFVLLTESTLVSTFTGERSTLAPDHRRFFFRVPTFEELVDLLEDRLGVVNELARTVHGEWCLRLTIAGQRCNFCAPVPEAAALDAVLALIAKVSDWQSPRLLRTERV